MQPILPNDVEQYGASKVFTQDTIPASLTRNHRTKPHSWGLIVVKEGALTYTREGHLPRRVNAGETAVIVPAEPHRVTPDGALVFQVEFYRQKRCDV